MLRARSFLPLLLLPVSFAAAQDISTAASSPYNLAKFVETHHDFDWRSF